MSSNEFFRLYVSVQLDGLLISSPYFQGLTLKFIFHVLRHLEWKTNKLIFDNENHYERYKPCLYNIFLPRN